MSQFFQNASSASGVVDSVTGTNGVTASPTTGNVVVSGVNATTSSVGVASFNPGEFTVNGAGQVSLITGGFLWTDEAVSFVSAAQNGYFCIATLTATLPPSAGLINGATIIFYVDSSNVLTIQTNTGQMIQVGDSTSAPGGTAKSSPLFVGSTLTIVYRIADSTWHSISSLGTWAVT